MASTAALAAGRHAPTSCIPLLSFDRGTIEIFTWSSLGIFCSATNQPNRSRHSRTALARL